MTTFTTEDRLMATSTDDVQIQMLSKMMFQQYNDVRDILDHVKKSPLTDEQIEQMAIQCMVPVFHTKFKPNDDQDDAIAQALTDALRHPIFEFARAIEKAHGIS